MSVSPIELVHPLLLGDGRLRVEDENASPVPGLSISLLLKKAETITHAFYALNRKWWENNRKLFWRIFLKGWNIYHSQLFIDNRNRMIIGHFFHFHFQKNYAERGRRKRIFYQSHFLFLCLSPHLNPLLSPWWYDQNATNLSYSPRPRGPVSLWMSQSVRTSKLFTQPLSAANESEYLKY